MPKKCLVEGCTNNVFSHLYCKGHQYKRKDLKRVSIARSPVRKVSKKQQAVLKEKAELTKKDRLFYNEIWEERPHIDFETDEPIYGEPLTLYFHHVLPKEHYPQFRYKKWNIVLVLWETHSKAENNLDLTPKIKEYQQQLLKKYT